MDIGNIFSKFESNADKLGAVLGGLSALNDTARGWHVDIITAAQTIIKRLIENPHIPDLAHVWFNMTYPTNPTFKTAVMALVTGYIIEAVDIDPRLGRLGKALKVGGFGAVLGDIAVNILQYSGASSSPGSGSGSSGSRGSAW